MTQEHQSHFLTKPRQTRTDNIITLHLAAYQSLSITDEQNMVAQAY